MVAFEHLNSTKSPPPEIYGFLPPVSGATLNWYVIGVVGAIAGVVDRDGGLFVVRLAADAPVTAVAALELKTDPAPFSLKLGQIEREAGTLGRAYSGAHHMSPAESPVPSARTRSPTSVAPRSSKASARAGDELSARI